MRTNHISIRTITTTEQQEYSNNFQVLTKKCSLDLTNREIKLNISLPSDDFNKVIVLNISSSVTSTILYLISNNSRLPTPNTAPNYILEDRIIMDDVYLEQVHDKKLQVIVLNDHPDDFNVSDLIKIKNDVIKNGLNAYNNYCNDKESNVVPKEGCGGVIVP